MKNLIDKAFGDKSIPSLINNPFTSDCIDSIMLRTYRGFDNNFTTYATIEFTNGSTKGEQRIEAPNLPELMIKVYEFCQSLE